MAQKNRSKEIWLIPKRGSLHQTICLIDGITERKYNGTSWNDAKQNNLGVNLKNWGATKSGKNISSQSIRTLTAAVPQYLGFVYINNNTTPNSICITEAGKKLLERHKGELVKVKNLIEGDEHLIKQSEVVLVQMEKLQITNPIILKDCENILVFPFRMTLKLLLELDYLDREELAYFVFKIKDESEFDLTIQEIKNFRQLSQLDRKNLIDTYKKTHLGNITLVKASSASYYEGLCQVTGIVEKISWKPRNRKTKIPAIKIKADSIDYVRRAINETYANIDTYDFGNNLDLWIEYIGNPNRLIPPVDIEIENKSNVSLLIQIFKDDIVRNIDFLEPDENLFYPMFLNEEYQIGLVDATTGEQLSMHKYVPTKENKGFNISSSIKKVSAKKTIEQLVTMILEHSACTSFTGEMLNYLQILERLIGVNKTDDKSLRGAYYEYLFYQLLSALKEKGYIDDVVWNGKVGKYGLPKQAPGGKTGTADMVFIIGDTHYVLELTTIKSKSGQEKAEMASVPDHVRLYKDSTVEKVVGIFCAPIIHERNTAVMQSVIGEHGIELLCLTDAELLDKLIKRDI